MKNARYILPLLCLLLPTPLAAETGRNQTAPAASPAPIHPFFRDAVYPAWSLMTPQQALKDLRAAMEQCRERLNAIAAITPEQANFDNTFLAYTRTSENLSQVLSCHEHLVNTAETPERLAVRMRMMQEYAFFKQNLHMLPQVWQVLSSAAESSWAKDLDAPRKRIAESVLRDLRNTGVHLTPEQRARKAELEQEIQMLCFRFSSNLMEKKADKFLVFTDAAQLAGMPEEWMSRAAEAAKQQGVSTPESPVWVVNLTTAHAEGVLYHCSVEETRRKCWFLLHSAGSSLSQDKDNEPVIYRIMELRHELATLLGFRNHADMRAESRMLDSGEKALAFVDDMLRRSKSAWDAWVAAKLERYSHAAGKKLSALPPWNEKYILHHRVNPPQSSAARPFNSAALTPYLQSERVIQGMLRIWSGLLGVTYTELPTVCLNPGEPCPAGHVETWAEGIRCFAVHDAASGQHLGSFFLDLYPRQGKRTDLSWCFPLRTGNPGEPHLAAMIVNFPAPEPGKPHLLTHLHLHMLFHEFGHLMHMCLGHPELAPLASINVESDFIEVPSHLQESWIWEPEAIASFAVHHETGEPIPQELLQQLAASRTSSPIADHISMLISAKLDLELHMHFHEKFKGRPLDEVTTELLRPWIFPGAENTPSPFRTLTHCISAGYDAGFYTYKWSEVMADDAFTRFKQDGIFNPATGAHYRRSILTPGCSKPAAQLFRDFMGRDPDPTPLLKRFRAE